MLSSNTNAIFSAAAAELKQRRRVPMEFYVVRSATKIKAGSSALVPHGQGQSTDPDDKLHDRVAESISRRR